MEHTAEKNWLKEKYRIAGINTRMRLFENGRTKKQAQEYLCDFEGEEELFICLTEDALKEQQQKLPHLSFDECEYIWTCELFCRRLLEFGGFMLHASAVVYKDRAYLFSAPSGTGKSTHTQLWLKAFGEDNAYILNDDKPVIRLKDGQIMVYGTPWSGKTDFNKNRGVPLQGICFLERAKENHIQRIDAKDAVFKILNQTIRPGDEGLMSNLLQLIDCVLGASDVFRMGCNMSLDAAYTAYNEMSKDGTV